MSDIKQFKLTNGDELVCEVVEWPGDDDEDDSRDIVVRNAYKIISFEQDRDGNRYYGFRPWMIYQQDPDLVQLINGYHVVGEANPSTKVLEHYFHALKHENDDNEEVQKRVDQYMHKLKSMIEAALISTADTSGDSDGDDKIIKFPGVRFH